MDYCLPVELDTQLLYLNGPTYTDTDAPPGTEPPMVTLLDGSQRLDTNKAPLEANYGVCRFFLLAHLSYHTQHYTMVECGHLSCTTSSGRTKGGSIRSE